MAAIPASLMALYNQLEGNLGKHISAICGNGYINDHDNHCAHFVSHARGYTFGYTCRAANGGSSTAANIRVHEVFGRCPTSGLFTDRPNNLVECLAFVTKADAVHLATKTMDNIPKKHIGIYSLGHIYHYSNAQHKVIRETPDEFRVHYPGAGFEVYYGTFPLG